MFRFSMKSSAAVAPTTPAAVTPYFPSREAVATIRELFSRIQALKNSLADAERQLMLTVKNRESLELLAGEKPDDTIRVKKAACDSAKRELAHAQNDLRRAFLDESKRFAENRADAWMRVYAEIVQPQAEKISAARELLERAANDIVALLKPDSETTRRIEEIDEATKSWNTLCDELAAPGNAHLNVPPATKMMFSSFLQTIKLRDFEVILSRLRDALIPPPPPIRMRTEEEILREREVEHDRQLLQSAENERAAAAERAKLAEQKWPRRP